MNIHLTARMKTAAEFHSLYKASDIITLDNGKTLLYNALTNTSLPDRYELANFLLDEGCALGEANSEGSTVLHVLFGHVRHDIKEDTKLARRLIAAGADINALNKAKQSPFLWVINMKYIDEDLQPLYDIWFEHPEADFTTKSRYGFSLIELAAKVPYRAQLLQQMEHYLEQRSDLSSTSKGN
jgi:ankyrin repeat protein